MLLGGKETLANSLGHFTLIGLSSSIAVTVVGSRLIPGPQDWLDFCTVIRIAGFPPVFNFLANAVRGILSYIFTMAYPR